MSLWIEDWVTQLRFARRSGSSHAFVLAGNVTDYAARETSGDEALAAQTRYLTLRQTLDRILLSQHLGPYAFVLHYDVASGVKFATPEMLERFRKFLTARDKAARKAHEEKQNELAGKQGAPSTTQSAVAGKKAHAFGAFAVPVAPVVTRDHDDDDPRVKAEEDAMLEAQILEELPDDLRQFYLELDDDEKNVVRHLPDFDTRVAHLMNLAEAKAQKKVNPLAPDGPEEDAPFELPEKPAIIWAFLKMMLAIELDEFAKHLKSVDPAFGKGLIKAPVAVIIHRPELAVDGGRDHARLSDFEKMVQSTLISVATDIGMERRGNLVVLVTEDENLLPESLTKPTSGFTVIEVPHPNHERRATFIEALPTRLDALVSDEVRFGKNPLAFDEGVTVSDVARSASAGLRLLDIEMVGREALVRRANPDDDTPRLTVDALWSRKKIYLKSSSAGQIKVERPISRLDWIGGQVEIKKYFARVAQNLRTGNRSRVPKGVLLVGPPGTGKSTFAQALAYLAGYAYCEIEGEADPFVGMSARNFKRNRSVIMRMEPVIVFEDEIDRKHLPRGAVFHGDSGTAAHQEALNHEFMADESRRGKVLWISAANMPNALEAALTRPGRFDRIIPVLPPKTPEGWADVFEGIGRKMTATVAPPFKWDVPREALIEIASKFPPDTMQAHANEFCYRALDYTGTEGILGPDELMRGVNDYRPRKEPEYKKQIDLALEYANSEELVPAEYRTSGTPVVVEEGNLPKVTGVTMSVHLDRAPPGMPLPPGVQGGDGNDSGDDNGGGTPPPSN